MLNTQYLKVMMVQGYVCILKDGDGNEIVRRTYTVGSPEQAAKKFLNYFRRFRKERPTEFTVLYSLDCTRQVRIADCSWYKGKLKAKSALGDAEGEWWAFKGWKKQEPTVE